MRILLISFYYPPDITPGSFRAKSLVDALVELSSGDMQIDVLTTMPNRYHSFSTEALDLESDGPVTIRRFSLPTHKSGMKDQARAFISFVRGVLKATKGGQWDLVVATSSRLMTAALGAWVSKQCKAKLYLDIRDLFTDTMEDVLAQSPMRHLLPVIRRLEGWTFRAADQINVVSAGFLPHINRVVPQITPSTFTNGIDDLFLNFDFQSDSKGKPIVLYAGNMGEGQGLHHVIPKVSLALGEQVCFRLLGDGGRRKDLEVLLEQLSVHNVELLDPVPRQQLFDHYRDADILFLHLNDFKAFHKVLPSKIFEYAATGKPILAGVGGYAAEFLKSEVPGVEVFDPCDVDAMQYCLLRLINGPKVIDRRDFCARYRRHEIMQKMSKEILSMSPVYS